MQLAELERFQQLRNRWVAIDPRGGQGLVPMRNGAVVVDFDSDVGALCVRIEKEGRRSIEIRFLPAPLAS